MNTHEVELRKERFFFRRYCAYCRGTDRLGLDSVQPYTWVKDTVWQLTDYKLERLFITDIQILCDVCMRRKKQIWKKCRNEEWAKTYLTPPELDPNLFGSNIP